jgi:alpha,alpha-trehalose-phosphate synthase [UDP-forming]/trehalose-phosphatase
MSTVSTEADRLATRLAHHPRLALLLDLDGTMIPFAATPEAAVLDRAGIELLDALHRAKVQVVVVTGRMRSQVEPLTELAPHAWWVAEHGAWRRDDREIWTGPPNAPELEELARLLEPFASQPGARVERKSLSLCLHWRLVAPELKDALIAGAELACDEWLESNPDLERLEGVEMLEVRRRSANKGVAVPWVRQRLPDVRLIAIGDDTTDEDMFAELEHDELAIGVGVRRAHTRCHVAGPPAVRELLAWLVQARTTGTDRAFDGFEGHPDEEPAERARLLVVSNRIPPATTGRQRSVGGLVSALEPALEAHDGMWLGWNGGESSGERRLTVDGRDAQGRCGSIADTARPIRASFEFAPTWRDRFYGGFCNRALWPLFHGFPGRARYEDDEWLAYVEANAEFARHASELAATDGTVWVHDYHLLLAGRGLRQRGFAGPLGLFLHIPFPSRDLFDMLPWADEIVQAMLEFDLLGFHTEQWAQNFRDCARDRLGGRKLPEIAVLPIGIDPRAFAPTNEPVDREVAGLQAVLGPRRMILGVDRLDYAKGIPERLTAFERLLEGKPEWRGQIAFVQISVPSRADVPEYAELRQQVENLVGRINGRFGEADWVPVRYLYRSYDHRVLAQLFRAADVALVTPLRDGLNLVAKEFVAAQDPDRPGVLVLSKFAGAAAELRDAVITNPFHPDGLAGDLDRALRMDAAERKRRHALLSAAIADRTPQRWAAVFLDRLDSAHRSRS